MVVDQELPVLVALGRSKRHKCMNSFPNFTLNSSRPPLKSTMTSTTFFWVILTIRNTVFAENSPSCLNVSSLLLSPVVLPLLPTILRHVHEEGCVQLAQLEDGSSPVFGASHFHCVCLDRRQDLPGTTRLSIVEADLKSVRPDHRAFLRLPRLQSGREAGSTVQGCGGCPAPGAIGGGRSVTIGSLPSRAELRRGGPLVLIRCQPFQVDQTENNPMS